MGRSIQWDSDAWEDYCHWQQIDKDALRNPFEGIGKPEPLKHDLAGLWSRRINNSDRLTYKLVGDVLVILACKGHYDK